MSGKEWVRQHLFRQPSGGAPVVDPKLPEWLERVQLAPAQQVDSLELTPLLLAGRPGALYTLAGEAIERGLLEVEERGDAAVVRTVRAVNRGDAAVLILEGDTLVGCKQNRIVAHSILVAPGRDIDVQVGCMEAGRWAWTGRHFGSGKLRADPRMRSDAAAEVITSRGTGRGTRIDQSRLWKQIDAALLCRSVKSPTSDYHRLVELSGEDADERASRFTAVRDQIGIIATWRGRLLGLELVGHPECWTKLSQRTIPSYVMGAANADAGLFGEPTSTERSAAEWLDLLKNAPTRTRRGAGLGIDLEIMTKEVHGTGLWHEDHPPYLALFTN